MFPEISIGQGLVSHSCKADRIDVPNVTVQIKALSLVTFPTKVFDERSRESIFVQKLTWIEQRKDARIII